jgi:hypothetical protein
MPDIYFGGALFNGPDNLFNIALARKLENIKIGEKSPKKRKHKVILPQTQGFEFGRLHTALSEVLPENEVMGAVQNIIYALDVGKFLPDTYMIARCDEPLDPGVDIELAISHFYGNFNIGYRTDVRSPYGEPTDSFGGMHFFPGFMCDAFILAPMPCRTLQEADCGLEKLADKIDNIIDSVEKIDGEKNFRWKSPSHACISEIQDYARALFDGISNLHSEKGMKEIAKRYVDTQKDLKEAILPRFYQV